MELSHLQNVVLADCAERFTSPGKQCAVQHGSRLTRKMAIALMNKSAANGRRNVQQGFIAGVRVKKCKESTGNHCILENS